jgi:hypothetical protein
LVVTCACYSTLVKVKKKGKVLGCIFEGIGGNTRLRSHCFIPPSKDAPAAIVFTAARLVVEVAVGKTVCKLVLVVAAAAKPARPATKRVLEIMLMKFMKLSFELDLEVDTFN